MALPSHPLTAPPPRHPRMRPSASRRRSRGVAALLVTLLVLAIGALALWWAHATLQFEQRTLANRHREALAFHAADSGLQWALAALNQPWAADATCQATPTHPPWRRQRLQLDEAGHWIPLRGAGEAHDGACVRTGGAWHCLCQPTATDWPAFEQNGPDAPGHAVRLEPVADAPGVLSLQSVGCHHAEQPCRFHGAPEGEARRRVAVRIATVPALQAPPLAAITVTGRLTAHGGVLQAWHTSPASGGWTVHAGAELSAPGLSVHTVQGTPGPASIIAPDAQLGALDTATFFTRQFGLPPALYRAQPTVAHLDCRDDCGPALRQAHALGARVLWLDHSARIASTTELGRPDDPALLIAPHGLLVHAGLRVHGLVHAHGLQWHGSSTWPGEVHGALSVAGDLDVQGDLAVHHDRALLVRLARSLGSFARVAGSWRDF